MKVKPQLYNTLLTLLTTTDKVKTRAMPKRVRTPNCTHVDMDRIYGQHQQCFVCGREPSIGFLYECRQDCSTRSFQELCLQGEGRHVSCSKSPLRTELEAAGLSESVIQSAEQGHYTSAQLKVLNAQKLDLRQTIEDSIQGTQINDVVARLAALSSPSSNNDGTASSKSKDTVNTSALQGSDSLVDVLQSSPCNFRACHTCRPYYRDRVFISFEAVASAEFAPISKDEAQHLPTKSANTIRYLKGAQPSPPDQAYQEDTPRTLQTSATFTCTSTPNTASTTSDSSELTFKTTQTDVDELRALRRPRRRFYNIGHKSSDEIARHLSRLPSLLSRQGLKTAMQAVFLRPNRDDSSDGSLITLPVVRTGTVRDDPATEPVGEFDIGALRRVRRQKEKADLRRGTFVHGFESLGEMPAAHKHGDGLSSNEDRSPSRSSESEFSVYSCVSDASGIEIDGEDGGVALEEGEIGARGLERCKVDGGDAGMNGVEDGKARSCVKTTAFEIEDEDEDEDEGDEGDGGLQGMMVQV
jgi:hypothetical protein